MKYLPTNEMVSLLGTRPDSEVAKIFNIDRRSVCQIRNELNITAFKGLILTKEGNACRSIYEAMYDAYLHYNNKLHTHEVLIEKVGLIADFKIDNTYVEIAGMTGFEKYEKRCNKKKKLYKENNINVKWLSAIQVEELCKNYPIQIDFKTNRECEICNKKTHDLVKGVCRKCYMKRWHRQPKKENICDFCKNVFFSAKKKRFCRIECYWKSMEYPWPSDKMLMSKLNRMTINSLSKELNVSYTGLWKHLKRRNIKVI